MVEIALHAPKPEPVDGYKVKEMSLEMQVVVFKVMTDYKTGECYGDLMNEI